MAATLSLLSSLNPRHNFKTHKSHKFSTFTPKPHNPILILHKSSRCNFSSSSETTQAPPPPLRTSGFLSNNDLEKLQTLDNFKYFHEFGSGSLRIRVMRADEMDSTSGLLSESFAESMLLPLGYVSLLKYLVNQYLIERRGVIPHAVTLIGFYRENRLDKEEENVEENEDEVLAGTVEISFNKFGANASLPTPKPPKNAPYICNMTVAKSLRRRGIGWHLLKASEELISIMSSSREVYLHCRMIDSAPFQMYTKANYNVVMTDSILILLTLQRRKHLMYKKLPVSNGFMETDISGSEEELQNI